jgi:putative membrane protein
LLAVAYLMPSVTIQSFGAALIGALVLGFANAVVRPILVLLTLPVTVLTLGLFIFVINGIVFLGVTKLVPGFDVAGLWPAILAAILYSIVS